VKRVVGGFRRGVREKRIYIIFFKVF